MLKHHLVLFYYTNYYISDIMHQEELGLLKKEILLIYESLTPAQKSTVDTKLQNTPKIPGFPSITRSLAKVELIFIVLS